MPRRLSGERRHSTCICWVQEWMNSRMGTSRVLISLEVCGWHCCLPTKHIFPSSSLSVELPFYLWLQGTSEMAHFPRILASREGESEGHVTQFGSMRCADVISEFLRKLFFFFLVFLLFLFLWAWRWKGWLSYHQKMTKVRMKSWAKEDRE